MCIDTYMCVFDQNITTFRCILLVLGHVHIFCSNSSIFVKLIYYGYFIPSLFKIYAKKIDLKTINDSLRSSTSFFFFSCKNLTKLRLKYQSYPGS